MTKQVRKRLKIIFDRWCRTCFVYHVLSALLSFATRWNGPAGPAVDSSAFGRVWSERPIKLIGIGDSVTAGLGAASKDHSYFNRFSPKSGG